MIHKKVRKDQLSLGILILAVAIVVVVHWGLVDADYQSAFVWGIIDAAFIVMPFFYFFTVCKKGIRKHKCKEIDYSIIIPFVGIALLTVYQLATGKFANPDLMWDYIDAVAVVSYAFAAGKIIK